MKKLLLSLVLIGTALAGIIVWFNYPRTRTIAETTFSYSSVEKGLMVETISATGVVQIEPGKMVVVGSEMPGTVVAIQGKVNDRVQEGALLLKLDDRQIRLKWEEAQNGLKTGQAAMAQAEAALAQAEALQKAAQLGLKYQEEIEKKGGFRSERDQAAMKVKGAQAGVDAAKAGVSLAGTKLLAAAIANRETQLALEKTKIRVPLVSMPARARSELSSAQPMVPGLDFLIMACHVKLGQQVGPLAPTPLFILACDLHHLEVHAQVAEGDIGKVKKGLVATFTVTAFSDENIDFRGQVKEIHPLPSNLKGAIYYDTVIAVDNQKDAETGEWRLRPGMTAAIDIIRREHNPAWKMPTAALNFQMEEAYQSAAARARLAEWKARPNQKDWKPVWIWDADQDQPWPIFVRIGGLNKQGEPGLKDGGFNEVLEWEPDREPTGNASLRIITNAPPAHTPGFFDRPANIKLS